MMTLQKETRGDAKETCLEGSSENSEHRVSQHFCSCMKALKKVAVQHHRLHPSPTPPPSWLLHNRRNVSRSLSDRHRNTGDVAPCSARPCCCGLVGVITLLAMRLLAKRQHGVTLDKCDAAPPLGSISVFKLECSFDVCNCF